MNRRRLPLGFELGRHATAGERPTAWIPAQVPGAVQLDWARAHALPDYTIGGNVALWSDLDACHWTYRAQLGDVALDPDERLWLVLEGIDYAAEIRLGGEWMCSHEGVYTPVELDVTDRRHDGAWLEIRLQPAPKSQLTATDRTQANRSCKPAVSYGWDFHPRLIPLGLWRDAYLEIRPGDHFARRPELAYRIAEDMQTVRGLLRVALRRGQSGGPLRLRWILRGPDDEVARRAEMEVASSADQVNVPFELAGPALWWPHDQGAAACYRSVVELLRADGAVIDRDERTVGFRRVRLMMAPDQWKQPGPVEFPKTRSDPPMTLEINGRTVFAKGSNWVCPDVFPGAVTRERLEAQLVLARGANLNLLRMWGGAAAPPDAFYDRCDELGMMVWQEFPLACNAYPDDPEYLAVLDRESRSLIERLRDNPCVVLWCGGNELFNAWSGMTDQSLALRLLNRNCYELDPTRPFLATSPLGGVGHGHYVFRDPITGRECWEIFQTARCTAYTEFGCPSTPSAATVRRIVPTAELWPPRAGTAWETHHAFGAWLPSSHLYLEQIEFYFGTSDSLEQLVERSQLLQSAGYLGLFEEARRQKPGASMALNWCFNEPWTCAANNSLVAWPCEPKPALTAVAAACRPVLASARIRKFSWSPGEVFDPELWLLNDGPTAVPVVEIIAALELDETRQEIGRWTTAASAPNTNQRGPRIEFTLPVWSGPLFALRLEVAGPPEWSSNYTLIKARQDAEPVQAATIPQGATNF